MILPITKIPTPSLHEPSKKLTREEIASPEIQGLIDDMIPSMYVANGIGLAAPQVAHNVQICILGKDCIPGNFPYAKPGEDLILINPILTRTGKKARFNTEGCLSVPGQCGKVRRLCNIHIEALDRHGEALSFDVVHKEDHDFGHVLQHEIDHLNSTLYIDKAESVWDVE